MKQRAIVKNKETGEVKAVALNVAVSYKKAGWENATEGEYDEYRAKVAEANMSKQVSEDDSSDDWRKDVKSIDAFAAKNSITFPEDVKKKPAKIAFIEKTMKDRAAGGGVSTWRDGSVAEILDFAKSKDIEIPEGVDKENRDALIGYIDAELASE